MTTKTVSDILVYSIGYTYLIRRSQCVVPRIAEYFYDQSRCIFGEPVGESKYKGRVKISGDTTQ